MPKVLCTNPNASEDIDGVKFEAVEGGMLSEEMSEEAAARLCAIPGYAMADGEPAKKAGKKPAKAEKAESD